MVFDGSNSNKSQKKKKTGKPNSGVMGEIADNFVYVMLFLKLIISSIPFYYPFNI